MVDILPPSNAPKDMLPWVDAIEKRQAKSDITVQQVVDNRAVATGTAAAAFDAATAVQVVVKEDKRVPDMVPNVTVGASAYYDNDGISRAYIDVAWESVVTATDGSDISGVQYELWYRNTNEPVEAMRRATATDQLNARINNLESGMTYYTQVRSLTALGVPSEFSEVKATLTPTAHDAPPVPTAPTLTTALGSVTVTWDGTFAGGVPQPGWVNKIQVFTSNTSGGTYLPVGTPLAKAGSVVLADLTVGSTKYVKLGAYSVNGDLSLLSGASSIVVSGVDIGDVSGLSSNLANAANTASNAFAQANAAFGQANSAYGQANTATSAAVSAGTLATNAQAAADAILAASPELFSNPGFEDNTYWAFSGATVYNTSSSHTGLRNALTASVAGEILSPLFPTTAGRRYRVTYWLNTGSVVSGGIRIANSSNATIGTLSLAFPNTATLWAKQTYDFTVPAGTTQFKVRWASSAGSWRIDDVSLLDITDAFAAQTAADAAAANATAAYTQANSAQANAISAQTAAATAQAAADTALAQAPELIINPSFEMGPTSAMTNWTLDAGVSVSSGTAHLGNRSLSFATLTSGLGATSGAITLTPGSRLRISGWSRSGGTNFRGWVRLVDATGVDISASSFVLLPYSPSGTWQRASADFTVPAGVTTAYLRVVRLSSSNSGYIDDVSLLDITDAYAAQQAADAANANAIAANNLATNANSLATNANSLATSANTNATAAYGQANSAYGQANTATNTAVNAFSNANAAYTQANTAYGQANSAYTQANTATSDAANALTAANTAQAAAVSAQNTANGKNAAYRSTSAAPTTGLSGYNDGDLWFQYSGSVVIGQWIFSSGAFVSQALASTVIASVDAGTISTGFLDVANRITTNAIYGNQLVFNSVVGHDIIADGTITGPLIQGDAIDGMTITGAIIRTGISNPRVELDSYGFHGYAANAVETTSVLTDGKLRAIDAEISGVYRTSPVGTGRRIEITPNVGTWSTGVDGSASMRFLLAEPYTTPNANGAGSYSYTSGMYSYIDTVNKNSQTTLTGPSFSKSLSSASGETASGGSITFFQSWTGAGQNTVDYNRGRIEMSAGDLRIASDNTTNIMGSNVRFVATNVNVDAFSTTFSGNVALDGTNSNANFTITKPGAGAGFIHNDPSNHRTVQTGPGSIDFLSGGVKLATVETGTNATTNTTQSNAAATFQVPVPTGWGGIGAFLSLRNNATSTSSEAALVAGSKLDLGANTVNVAASGAVNFSAPIIRNNSRPYGVPPLTTANRATYFPSPQPGDRYFDTTLMCEMVYIAAATGVVRATGWYPVTGAVPSMGLERTTTTSIAAATVTPINLNSWSEQPGVAWGGTGLYSSNTLTVPQSGKYLLSFASVLVLANAVRFILRITLNGSSFYESGTNSNAGTSVQHQEETLLLTQNDTLLMSVRHDDTAARDMTSARFSLTYLNPA